MSPVYWQSVSKVLSLPTWYNTDFPSGVKAGQATYPDAPVARLTMFEKVFVDATKSAFAIVCASWSSRMKASCLPSGEKLGVPAALITESHPAAAMLAPVFVLKRR